MAQQIDIAPAAAGAGTHRHFILFLQKADGLLAGAAGNGLLQTHERAPADEENVGGVHRREFLVRVLAPALRRNVGHRAFEDFQQRLLHALAGDIAGDRRVLVLAWQILSISSI
jgi:hypothetical protein